jgi:hypothetical protein
MTILLLVVILMLAAGGLALTKFAKTDDRD